MLKGQINGVHLLCLQFSISQTGSYSHYIVQISDTMVSGPCLRMFKQDAGDVPLCCLESDW